VYWVSIVRRLLTLFPLHSSIPSPNTSPMYIY
jgi:hypothetical protein